MKIVSILSSCLLVICSAFTQAHAFEAMTTGKGTPQYRFKSSEFVYLKGNTNNIDITAMLARQGINQRGLKLERLKLLINGKVTATFHTYSDKGIQTLNALNATRKNRILFIQNTAATQNRGWLLVLSNPNNFSFEGMHITIAP